MTAHKKHKPIFQEEYTMNSKSLLSLLALVFALTALPHCGGGGGGGGGAAVAPRPTTAVLNLSTANPGGLPANTIITGYDVTITLPAGVTVKSTTPPEVDDGVATVTGAAAAAPGSSIAAVYSPAAGVDPAKVRIIIANGNGFSAGAFCKITCNIDAGSAPSKADFAKPTLAASGYNSNSDSTVDLTADLSVDAAVSIK
jgi:hypothetical protein